MPSSSLESKFSRARTDCSTRLSLVRCLSIRVLVSSYQGNEVGAVDSELFWGHGAKLSAPEVVGVGSFGVGVKSWCRVQLHRVGPANG